MSLGRGLARFARGVAADIEAFALPQRCPGCDAPARAERLLCAACNARLQPLAMPLCASCLARGGEPVGCLAHPGHAVWAAWVYDERVALLVHALKYDGRPQLARELSLALARALGAGAPGRSASARKRFDLIVEVPLHRARHRERGYNQAGALAERLAGRIGVPHLAGALERVRPTPPQARLGPAARRANLASAFRVRRPEWLAGRNVLIVDDVLTTGATLEACFDALGRAGAHPTGVALAWAQ